EFDLDLGLVSARSTPLNNLDLFALADNEKVIYLPQFYNGKASLETADDVPVTAPNVTSNIDFKMVRAATIQGVVNLPSGNPVGADSLSETLVLAYDADTKEVRGGGETTFAGGYRIVGLPPGNYKVEAAPVAEGYAATYHGGGTTFTDANSTVLSVAPDETKLANIDLATGEGVISGMIYNLDGTIPLPGVLVLAYDQSGHAVSAGMSGFDISRDVPLANPGEYHIPGLVSGSYFVRTFALFQLLTLVEDLGGGLGDDPLTALLGLLLGTGDASLTSLNIQLFGDVWYQAQPVEINLDNLDLFSLLFNLILSGGDPQFILPFFDVVPAGAQLVSVTSPGEKTGINFNLPGLNLRDILSDVEESPDIALQPETFQLFQNYPNPFNPSTVINFRVPRAADIQLHVYNLLGQRIRTLFEGRKAAGVYTTQWDGLNDKGEIVSAGIYFLRLESDNLSLTRKMLLVK
ncbi:MAG: T9SS type A sorting domain-containing protein, partial [bacterium]